MNNSPDAMLDVYVPGAWRCPKCQFALQKATMFVQSGTIGSTREDVMNLTGEVCPNDGEPMLRETWHQRSEDNYKWGVGLMEEIIALVGAESLPAAIEKIKALRADALAPPEPTLQELARDLAYYKPIAERLMEEAPRKVQQLHDVLRAIRRRLHFVGMPQEPRNEYGRPKWSAEIALIENALREPAPPRADALEAPPTENAVLLIARRAVNSWACYAKREIEHNAISALHREIDIAAAALDASPQPPQDDTPERP